MSTSAPAMPVALPVGAPRIAGESVTPTAGGSELRVNPSSGEPLAAIAIAGDGEVGAAVEAARAAFASWRATAPAARRALLMRIADELDRHQEELGTLQTLEMGQIHKATRLAAGLAAEWFRYYAGWIDKLDGGLPGYGAGRGLDYVVPEPYGVIGAVIPWNGPVISFAIKVAPALAAGNCVVLKPSELAPFAALRMAELCDAAGLPPGVLNVVTGGAATGQALCRHPGVDKVTFTGGPAAGRAVGLALAERNAPGVLELGGKSASIVFADADPVSAGKLGALLGVAQNAGQGCFLPTRLLVERPAYDEVVEHVLTTARGFRLGDPFDPGTKVGPVVSEAACDRIVGVIERAASDGDGRLALGGHRADGDLARGSFVEPTVFVDVDNASRLAQEEIFGPVLAVIAFDDEDEALAMANDGPYGLAGYVHTNDLRRAHRVAAGLDAGYVSVNGMALLDPAAPFGGWKQSGYGTEGSRRGIEEFLRLKNVFVATR